MIPQVFETVTRGVKLRRMPSDTEPLRPQTRLACERKGYAHSGDKYGVVLQTGNTLALNPPDPPRSAGFVLNTSHAIMPDIAKNVLSANIDVALIREAYGTNNPDELRRAIDEPNRPTGIALRVTNPSPETLAGLRASLADPAFLERVITHQLTLTVVHELMHTMKVSHHGPTAQDGDESCVMRYYDEQGFDDMRMYLGEYLGASGPLPPPYRYVCNLSPDNCLSELNASDH
jgi:hypothetical protein